MTPHGDKLASEITAIAPHAPTMHWHKGTVAAVNTAANTCSITLDAGDTIIPSVPYTQSTPAVGEYVHVYEAGAGAFHVVPTAPTMQSRSSVITAASGGTPISFPAPFASPPTVTACLGDVPTVGNPTSVYVVGIMTTGFTVRVYRGDGTEATSGGYRINWVATKPT